MPEATQKREKPASINRRIREFFLEHPRMPVTKGARMPVTKGELRTELLIPPDTEITARIREIRNHPRNPMNIPCDHVKECGQTLYIYTYIPLGEKP
jgi:hypothetical protein